MSIENTLKPSSEPSSNGLLSYLALVKFFAVKAPLSTIISPPSIRFSRLVTSAAGFIATNTSVASPAVVTSSAPK